MSAVFGGKKYYCKQHSGAAWHGIPMSFWHHFSELFFLLRLTWPLLPPTSLQRVVIVLSLCKRWIAGSFNKTNSNLVTSMTSSNSVIGGSSAITPAVNRILPGTSVVLLPLAESSWLYPFIGFRLLGSSWGTSARHHHQILLMNWFVFCIKASGRFPENTIASFEAAIRDGSDGIESGM